MYSHQSSDSAEGFTALRRHEEYYLTGGDLFFLIEQNHFRVHRYFFERESQFFKTQLATPASPGATRQGTSESTAIVLDNVKAANFAKLLWVFYNPKYSLYKARVDDWVAIMELAHGWGFHEVMKLATREIERLEMPDIDRIVAYHKFEIDRGLLLHRYAALTARKEPLTLEEGLELGMETTIKIFRARELARASPADDGTRKSTQVELPPEEMQSLIMNLFEIPEYSEPPREDEPPRPPAIGQKESIKSSLTVKPISSVGQEPPAPPTKPPTNASTPAAGSAGKSESTSTTAAKTSTLGSAGSTTTKPTTAWGSGTSTVAKSAKTANPWGSTTSSVDTPPVSTDNSTPDTTIAATSEESPKDAEELAKGKNADEDAKKATTGGLVIHSDANASPDYTDLHLFGPQVHPTLQVEVVSAAVSVTSSPRSPLPIQLATRTQTGPPTGTQTEAQTPLPPPPTSSPLWTPLEAPLLPDEVVKTRTENEIGTLRASSQSDSSLEVEGADADGEGDHFGGSTESWEGSSDDETRVDSNEQDDFHDILTTEMTDEKHEPRKDDVVRNERQDEKGYVGGDETILDAARGDTMFSVSSPQDTASASAVASSDSLEEQQEESVANTFGDIKAVPEETVLDKGDLTTGSTLDCGSDSSTPAASSDEPSISEQLPSPSPLAEDQSPVTVAALSTSLDELSSTADSSLENEPKAENTIITNLAVNDIDQAAASNEAIVNTPGEVGSLIEQDVTGDINQPDTKQSSEALTSGSSTDGSQEASIPTAQDFVDDAQLSVAQPTGPPTISSEDETLTPTIASKQSALEEHKDEVVGVLEAGSSEPAISDNSSAVVQGALPDPSSDPDVNSSNPFSSETQSSDVNSSSSQLAADSPQILTFDAQPVSPDVVVNAGSVEISADSQGSSAVSLENEAQVTSHGGDLDSTLAHAGSDERKDSDASSGLEDVAAVDSNNGLDTETVSMQDASTQLDTLKQDAVVPTATGDDTVPDVLSVSEDQPNGGENVSSSENDLAVPPNDQVSASVEADAIPSSDAPPVPDKDSKLSFLQFDPAEGATTLDQVASLPVSGNTTGDDSISVNAGDSSPLKEAEPSTAAEADITGCSDDVTTPTLSNSALPPVDTQAKSDEHLGKPGAAGSVDSTNPPPSDDESGDSDDPNTSYDTAEDNTTTPPAEPVLDTSLQSPTAGTVGPSSTSPVEKLLGWVKPDLFPSFSFSFGDSFNLATTSDALDSTGKGDDKDYSQILAAAQPSTSHIATSRDAVNNLDLSAFSDSGSEEYFDSPEDLHDENGFLAQ